MVQLPSTRKSNSLVGRQPEGGARLATLILSPRMTLPAAGPGEKLMLQMRGTEHLGTRSKAQMKRDLDATLLGRHQMVPKDET
jgi:hypothetical protein